jgi:hypothetical protein
LSEVSEHSAAWWGRFIPEELRDGPLGCAHRSANENPEYVLEVREQISDMSARQLMHCISLAMDILKRDRTPLSKTRGMLMLNLLREERAKRGI